MANTYTLLYYHIVFSAKNRVGCIKPDIEQRVWEYIGGIARDNKMTALQVGGVEDHIHALVAAPPTLAPSKIAQLLKGGSSLWIHTEFPEIRNFAWQDGYGAFTIYGADSIVAPRLGMFIAPFPTLKGRAKLKSRSAARRPVISKFSQKVSEP